MGRPIGSKNKKKKQTIPVRLKEGVVTRDKQDYSFELDTITCIDIVLWNIRKEAEKIALNKAGENKKCVPKKFMEEAFIDLGLKKFLDF